MLISAVKISLVPEVFNDRVRKSGRTTLDLTTGADQGPQEMTSKYKVVPAAIFS